jgi:hypothetical protein
MFNWLGDRLNIENKNLNEFINLGNKDLTDMMGETVNNGFYGIRQSLNSFLVDLINSIPSCLGEENLSDRIKNLCHISSYSHNNSKDKLGEIFSLQNANINILLTVSK